MVSSPAAGPGTRPSVAVFGQRSEGGNGFSGFEGPREKCERGRGGERREKSG